MELHQSDPDPAHAELYDLFERARGAVLSGVEGPYQGATRDEALQAAADNSPPCTLLFDTTADAELLAVANWEAARDRAHSGAAPTWSSLDASRRMGRINHARRTIKALIEAQSARTP